MKPEWMPPLPTPRKKPVYATSKNTASVRSGYEMGGYEKEPPLWDENQMHDYALAAVEVYKASLKPAGYFQPHNVDETDERIPVIGWKYKSEAYTMPLYRLDGGKDE